MTLNEAMQFNDTNIISSNNNRRSVIRSIIFFSESPISTRDELKAKIIKEAVEYGVVISENDDVYRYLTNEEKEVIDKNNDSLVNSKKTLNESTDDLYLATSANHFMDKKIIIKELSECVKCNI